MPELGEDGKPLTVKQMADNGGLNRVEPDRADEVTGAPYAVEGQDTGFYAGVSAEYKTYATPADAASGDEMAMSETDPSLAEQVGAESQPNLGPGGQGRTEAPEEATSRSTELPFTTPVTAPAATTGVAAPVTPARSAGKHGVKGGKAAAPAPVVTEPEAVSADQASETETGTDGAESSAEDSASETGSSAEDSGTSSSTS